MDRTLNVLDSRLTEHFHCRHSGRIFGSLESTEGPSDQFALSNLWQGFNVHEGSHFCISFSQDGEYLPQGQLKGNWSLTTLHWEIDEIFPKRPSKRNYKYISFSPDQQSLLTTDSIITFTSWKWNPGQFLKNFVGHTSFGINCAIWLDEGAFVLSGSQWWKLEAVGFK